MRWITAAGLALIMGWVCPRAGAQEADVVSRWNLITLEAIRDQNLVVQSRTLAMVHAAQFDAVNAADRKFDAYLSDVRAPDCTLPAVAAVAAAHAVLIALQAGPPANLHAALQASLAGFTAGPARDRAVELGRRVAEQVVSARANDGSSASATYTPQSSPGSWQPTPPAFAPALAPQWGSVAPFLLDDVTRFAPPPPPALTSAAYAQAFTEVKRVGSKLSSERSADQTAASAFWTALAPSIWSSATRQALAQRPQLSLVERARVFALVTGAIADALVVAWAAKYQYAVWRPITAIRASADPAWEPLIVTPPFPCYVSGHAITSAAAAQVLVEVLGSDHALLTIVNPAVGVTRTYRRFSELANEAVDVRVWSGVHFRFSQVAGFEAGQRIGHAIAHGRLERQASLIR